MGSYFPIFSTAFDAFVAVLVEIGKILPQFLVSGINNVSMLDGGKLRRQVPDGDNMELVLVRLLAGCQFQRA